MQSSYITLSTFQVGLAAVLVLINAVISLLFQLKLAGTLLWASLRMVVQLSLVGYVLMWVFRIQNAFVVVGLMCLMALIAGIAAVRRTHRRHPGIWLDSILSVLISSWVITAVALFAVVQPQPWFQPQYAIPLTGMILGNILNGISLGLDRFTEELSAHRSQVETMLALGATRWEAARLPLQKSIRTGMIPTINTMMVAGIVSLPGMMTGQLLSGVEPLEAVKYQIVIIFFIASAAALGTVGVVLLSYRRLFNSNHQFLHGHITKV